MREEPMVDLFLAGIYLRMSRNERMVVLSCATSSACILINAMDFHFLVFGQITADESCQFAVMPDGNC